MTSMSDDDLSEIDEDYFNEPAFPAAVAAGARAKSKPEPKATAAAAAADSQASPPVTVTNPAGLRSIGVYSQTVI